MTQREKSILGLCELGGFIREFLNNNQQGNNEFDNEIEAVLRKSEVENPWFTFESQRFALQSWADLLVEDNIKLWLQSYQFSNSKKRVGLILAGNIPLVGFHDVISVILSGNIPIIKCSSKDRQLIPFLLKKWNAFSNDELQYEIVDKLDSFDAIIATGSNNTAKYLEFYFKDYPRIIRKNRTSVAVLSGSESDGDLQKLADDIFIYFGLGCRNVTKIFIPHDFKLDRLFENFINYKEIINHHKYANNYDYNRAIYLLNQDQFWDNNFVLLKEDPALFSPLSVVNFSRYTDIEEVKDFLHTQVDEIQCIVAGDDVLIETKVGFGEAQCPSLTTYADDVDTMLFLQNL